MDVISYEKSLRYPQFTDLDKYNNPLINIC
jgi:hypothetical protein